MKRADTQRPTRPLGVILAGGQSRRYGRPKALVTVGGQRLIDRIRGSLEQAGLRVVLVANDPEVYREVGLEVRPDAGTSAGPLAGIRTALLWAAEENAPGAVVLACDMPFVPAALIARLASAVEGADAVVPLSPGPRGVEPLCAYYAVSCLPALEAALARGQRTAAGLLERVKVERISLAEVQALGPPEQIFLNVNTASDRRRAERLLKERTAPPPGST
ncbi:MAG: molybdenum cofactor guanylyltransferase [Gemmatimonadetes bacterium]|nr:molybdenum cofactor guanylyltransferase [Gemmatimonadota bacterium]